MDEQKTPLMATIAQNLGNTNLQSLNNCADSHLKLAAVLVPLILETEEVLFIKRSTHLHKHSGEIAFPGGAMESSDHTLIDTVYREVFEEISIPASFITIIGVLPPIISTTQYYVTPIVATLLPFTPYFSESAEVEDVFFVPLLELVSPKNHKTRAWGKRVIHLYYWQQRVIWGVTGQIVYNLLNFTKKIEKETII